MKCLLSSKFGKQEKINDFLNLINKKWNVCIYLFGDLELFAFFFFLLIKRHRKIIIFLSRKRVL